MKKIIILGLLLLSCNMLNSSNQIGPKDVLIAFQNNNLECENIQQISKLSKNPLPKVFSEGEECQIPSLNQTVRVFSFIDKRDLRVVKEFYEGFDKLIPSHLFVCGNFLFQTKQEMSKELATQYEKVFLEICK